MPMTARAAIFAALVLAPGCSDSSGPTAIEIPISDLVITNDQACRGIVPDARCQFLVEARTEAGQLVSNPVLRWFSSNSTIASVNDSGQVEATGSGTAMVTVTNSTGTVSDTAEVLVHFVNPK